MLGWERDERPIFCDVFPVVDEEGFEMIGDSDMDSGFVGVDVLLIAARSVKTMIIFRLRATAEARLRLASTYFTRSSGVNSSMGMPAVISGLQGASALTLADTGSTVNRHLWPSLSSLRGPTTSLR